MISSGRHLLANNTKTKKPRTIHFIPEQQRALEALDISDLKESSDKLFYKNGDKKEAVTVAGFTRLFNSHIQKVLGQDFSSHSFRRGVITTLLKAGENPRLIQEQHSGLA